MKKIIIMALMAIAILPTQAENTATGDKITKSEKNDTVRIRYIHRLTEDDARIFESNLQKTVIYVNDQVTTHLIMPENIKLVDISTDKLVGNQCADNIVRLKPKSTLIDNELASDTSLSSPSITPKPQSVPIPSIPSDRTTSATTPTRR